ncbi:Hypothetical predicted protein [Mytilus galloprovincialis]|uniref:Fibrinogen C-terminal domain-containing protein n=1 Tax=Mytilus galloprovincialis TaxID=29158 RepID=A0A8B6FQX8_MYTGA|nr:Hypothetical predicted protein [Mytilus galloprovincialis]
MGWASAQHVTRRENPMYDTCLGNPCKYGEICESIKDEGVVCVKDQGNKYINLLTSIGSHKLRVELVRSDGMNFYAEYSNFDVGDGESKYILTVNGYSGNAGNYMEYNNGRRFTTYDRDYDENPYNCVSYHRYGAWWHGGCTYVDLNNQNINQLLWDYNSFIKSIMMIRKID